MTTYENIPKIIRQSGIIEWKIQRRKNDINSIVFRSDPEKTVEGNIELMNSFFSMDFSDYYLLTGTNREGKAAATQRFEFEFSNVRDFNRPQQWQQQTPAYVGVAPTQPASIGYTEEDLKKRMEILRREIDSEYRQREIEQAYKDLKEERRAFEAERNNGLNIALAKIGAFVPALFGGGGIVQQGIAGTPQEEANIVIPAPEKTGEENGNDIAGDEQNNGDIVQSLFNEWLALDSEATELLQKLVDLCKTNPAIYNMAKGYLKGM